MAKIVSVQEMVEIEKKADASGLNYDQMMENAGKSVAEQILRFWPSASGFQVLVLVGPGNNGGDGLVAGHYLSQVGAEVAYYLVKARSEGDPNFKRAEDSGGRVVLLEQDDQQKTLRGLIQGSDLIIDGVLGTGFKLPLKGGAQELISQVKRELERKGEKTLVAAIDCPSGVDCDTGETASETLAADITVTLAAVKQGLLEPPANELVGELFVGDIGLTDGNSDINTITLEMMDATIARAWLPPRSVQAHKGTFGKVLIVAGSINYPGAAALAALGAYRSGVGLVTLAVPEPIYEPLVGIIPEATWLLLPHRQGAITSNAVEVLSSALENAQALLVGPGFGLDRESQEFLARLFTGIGPGDRMGFIESEMQAQSGDLPATVIDADALKLIADLPGWPSLIPPRTVLTPHPGEMSVLSGLNVDSIQSDRIGVARKWAQTWGHILVLKGAHTIVASPDGAVMLIPIATSALSTAGTGDVLAGVISSLIAQGLEAFQAAALGAYIHGRAGLLAAGVFGTSASVIARDVADEVPEVFAELEMN